MMVVHALTVRFVVLPQTLEHIAICMEELSWSSRLVIVPVAFISGTVRPKLYTITFLDITVPLTTVDCPVLERHCSFIIRLDAPAECLS